MVIYTVKENDTLFRIAERFGTEVERIVLDNQLEEPDKLVVGQTLIIRAPLTVHTVSEGENIYSIAEKYRVTTNQIWRNNIDIGGKTALESGKTIVINDAPTQYARKIATSAYVYPSVNRELLMATLPYLTYLTVFSYGIEDDGYLGELEDEDIISLARQYGTSPIMHIANIDQNGNYSPELAENIISDRGRQDILIGDIIKKVTDKKYSGVLLDFEYVPREYAKDYVKLLERIDEKLGSGGRRLFSALLSNSYGGESEKLWEGDDYKEIGEITDSTVLQTYGWGNMYSEAGAIAPFDKVAKVCGYAEKNIDAKKLFLGVPNYGYDWCAGRAAVPIGNAEAVALALKRRVSVEYDAASASPYFEYYDDNRRRHKVCFEDARSVSASLSLVDELGLYGISVWNAMKAFPAMWMLINGSYDIEKL